MHSVYLVREVLYDPDVTDDDVLSPIDPFASFQFDSPVVSAVEHGTPLASSPQRRPRITSWGSDPFSQPQQSTYGRNFALKCLCKKDLTDELIQVQRGEAVLHRALPDHEYIVRLYGVSSARSSLCCRLADSHPLAGVRNGRLAVPRARVLSWSRSLLLAPRIPANRIRRDV